MDPVTCVHMCVRGVNANAWRTGLFSAASPILIHLNMSMCVGLTCPARRNAPQLRRIAHSFFSEPSVSYALSLPPGAVALLFHFHPVVEQNVFMAAVLADGLLTHCTEELCCAHDPQNDTLIHFQFLKNAPVCRVGTDDVDKLRSGSHVQSIKRLLIWPAKLENNLCQFHPYFFCPFNKD